MAAPSTSAQILVQRRKINAYNASGLPVLTMNLRRTRTRSGSQGLVDGRSTIPNTSTGAIVIQRSCFGFPLILAVGNLCLRDASSTKTYHKTCQIPRPRRYYTISSRTPARSSGVRLERYPQFYINYLQLDLSSSNTLYQAIVKLAQHFHRYLLSSGRPSPRLSQIHRLGM